MVNAAGPDPPRGGRPARSVTLARIARIAGVSVATVSKVINGRTGVSDATRRQIEEIVRETGYHRSGNTDAVPIVEVLFQALDSLWALEIIQGVEAVVRPHGLAVAITDMEGSLTPAKRWVDDLMFRRPVGVIGVSAVLTDAQRGQLASRAVPLVALDPTGEPRHRTPSVGAMNWNGGLAAARHLLELGHRRIAMINGPADLICCRARLDGWRAAMDADEVPVDPRYLRAGPLYVEAGLREASGLLRLPQPPTAIFTANDLQALGVYEAARQARVRVPEELSVVGFDDLPFARWAGPPLTTVRQPLREMGTAAAELVLALAAGGRPQQERVELETTLVVRGSTAPPPVG